MIREDYCIVGISGHRNWIGLPSSQGARVLGPVFKAVNFFCKFLRRDNGCLFISRRTWISLVSIDRLQILDSVEKLRCSFRSLIIDKRICPIILVKTVTLNLSSWLDHRRGFTGTICIQFDGISSYMSIYSWTDFWMYTWGDLDVWIKIWMALALFVEHGCTLQDKVWNTSIIFISLRRVLGWLFLTRIRIIIIYTITRRSK